jgi:hypothetical protein
VAEDDSGKHPVRLGVLWFFIGAVLLWGSIAWVIWFVMKHK